MNKTTYYINGNAVRELDEAAPVRRPQKSTRELEEIRRKKNRRTSARRNQERALSMNRAFVAFLTACVAASALVSVSLIQIRSNVTQQMKEVAALESRINDMKADNDARYKQITTSVDLNAIKDAAINRLGMKYASQDQIVYYSMKEICEYLGVSRDTVLDWIERRNMPLQNADLRPNISKVLSAC